MASDLSAAIAADAHPKAHPKAHPEADPVPRQAIGGSSRYGSQATFDELGTPLRDVTFVVVDLETTGGSPLDCEITEVGAVKVRGGVVEGEFQTLVNPGGSIPAFVQLLTGITESMVATAPTIASVLPAFLEFAKGPDVVLVAHNAPFDVGFLRAAADRTARPWPTFGVLDTARLARQVLLRDEAPDCRLATLARLFRATTMPTHRALDDARATVDVLHGLIERVGTQGVDTLEELSTYSARVSPAQRRKRHLAEGLPRGPGVYLFEDANGRVLYVGKSKDLRPRVRSYFTASEMRTRMAEMVRLAEHVRPVPCPTLLEAEVRELRLIAQHQPPYNRRSRFPERVLWLKLTVEPFPRLSMVRALKDDGAAYLGPFSSRRAADSAMTALHEAVPLRQCTPRIPADPSRARGSACALFGMGRCQAPCEGRVTESEYNIHVDVVRHVFSGDCRSALGTLEERIQSLSDAGRFEDAGMRRDRLGALVAAAARMQRLHGLVAAAELVAARPSANGSTGSTGSNGSNGGWELAVVRHGRLAGTDRVGRGEPVWPKVDALLATAERVTAGTGPTPAATAEESECILRWLGSNGTRLVQVSGTWSSPAHGAGAVRDRYAPRPAAAASQPPDTDRRRLRPIG